MISKIRKWSQLKFFQSITSYRKTSSVYLKSFQLPDRFRGTFIERWSNYWRDVVRDYVDVTKDAVLDLKHSPVKAVALFTIAGTVSFYVNSNPDENNFRDQFILYSNQLLFVAPGIRNPETYKHLQYIAKCYNQGTIRRTSLGLFSVIWIDNYDEQMGIYKAMCPYLKPDLLNIKGRLIDIGINSKWLILDKKMIDYDVNPNEWKD